MTPEIWKQRFEDINCFEHYLSRNGILVRKFFLNLSKGEQKKRFLARLDHPEKNWGNSPPATSTSVSTGTTTWKPTKT